MEGRPGVKAGRPFTMVSASLLNMGECTFNSFGAIGCQPPDCVAGQDRIVCCNLRIG